MYDLKIVVEEVRGFCDLPLQPGDYIEVRGGRLYIPPGKFFCIWALQSLMPMIPAKQRHIVEENDWLPHTDRTICPDPNGLVVFRFERIPGPKEEGPAQKPAQEEQMARHPSSQKGPSPSSLPAGGTSAGPAPDGAEQPSLLSQNRIPPRLLVDPAVCSGCRACELACSFAHEGVFDPTVARIQIRKEEALGLDFPVACRQCGVASCVKACPTGALRRDPQTKAVLLDDNRCTGCGLCLEACPFGAIRRHPRTNLPLICDLCGGEPACVARCATGALRFGRAGEKAPIGYRLAGQ